MNWRKRIGAPQKVELSLALQGGGAHGAFAWAVLDLNPLRDIVGRMVAFERLRRTRRIMLFLAATSVRSGRTRIFTTTEIDVQAVLASACIPQIHRAVRVGQRDYWNGGFTANPPVLPLVLAAASRDIDPVQIERSGIEAMPETAAEICDRLREMMFNAAALREWATLAALTALARRSPLGIGAAARRLRQLRFRAIAAKGTLPGNKLHPTRPLADRLFELGRTRAEIWLAENQDGLGRQSTTTFAAGDQVIGQVQQ